MRKMIVAAGVAAVAALSWALARPVVDDSKFRLELTPTATGYRAVCETGCRWESLSFDCAADCHAVIDANGVYPQATTKQGEAEFAFHLQRIGSGWRAESLGGTGWLSLGWSCGAAGCAARVTDHGVSGPA
jgi:hypothetical protein